MDVSGTGASSSATSTWLTILPRMRDWNPAKDVTVGPAPVTCPEAQITCRQFKVHWTVDGAPATNDNCHSSKVIRKRLHYCSRRTTTIPSVSTIVTRNSYFFYSLRLFFFCTLFDLFFFNISQYSLRRCKSVIGLTILPFCEMWKLPPIRFHSNGEILPKCHRKNTCPPSSVK